MGIYDGRHAELYDLFYGAKPYAAEVSYLHGLLQQFSEQPVRRVLDIACGCCVILPSQRRATGMNGPASTSA